MDGNLLRQAYEPITTGTVTAPPAQHHTQHIVVQKSMPPPFQPRETNLRCVWGEININSSTNTNNNNNDNHPKTRIMAFEPAEINHISELRVKRKTTRTIPKMISGAKQKADSSVNPTNESKEEQRSGVSQLETRGVWVITPLAQNVCEVTFVMNIVDKGKIPTSIVNANIGRALNPVTFLKAFYERTGLVLDAELRAEFVKNVPRTVNSITAEQQSFVQQEMDSIDYKNDTGWEKLDKDSSVFVKLSKKHNKGESNAWGKATTTIDTSAENVLAWFWDYCSNERLDAVNKLHKNPREVIKHIAPNHNVLSTIKALPWPLTARQFIYENTWTKQDDETYIYSWRPPTTHKFDDNRLVDIGKHKAKALVQGESRGFVILKNVGDQKCDLTYVLHADAKGNLPAKVIDSHIPKALRSVFQIREKFNRDDEIDQEERNELMGVMKNDENEVYSEEENEMVKRITKKMESVKDDLFTPLNSPDIRTKVSFQFVHFFVKNSN